MPIWNEVNYKIISAASQLSVDNLSVNCDILYWIRRIYVPAEYYSITPAMYWNRRDWLWAGNFFKHGIECCVICLL